MTIPVMGCWFDVTVPAGKVVDRPPEFRPERDQWTAVPIRSGEKIVAERVQAYRWHIGRTVVDMVDLSAWTGRAPIKGRAVPVSPLGRLRILDPIGAGQRFTVTHDRWPYRAWVWWYGVVRFGRILRGWWLVNAQYWRKVTGRSGFGVE